MVNPLYFREIGTAPAEATHRCLIVHGIMGSSQNWLGAARALLSHFPTWSIRLLDLPGHGASPHAGIGPKLPDIAAHVKETLDSDGWRPTILMGHSFGGKTMIELSMRYPEQPLDLWLLDAPMNADTLVTGTQTIDKILSVVEGLRAPQSRQMVLDAFRSSGLDDGIGQWMNTNLRRLKTGFEWKIEPSFIRAALKDYLSRDYWSFLSHRPEHQMLHSVLAGRSTWWRGEVERRLRKLPCSQLHTLHRAGHWVHIDDLNGLVQCLKSVYV
jgi:esterase